MTRFSSTFLALCLFAAPAVSQTTGVPGTNDYMINGMGSGTTSATSLTVPAGSVTFAVSTEFNAPVVFLFSFVPAVPGFVGLPAQTCSPAIPFTAISGTTNQSIDLDAALPMIAVPAMFSGDGFSWIFFDVPPGAYSTQAVSLHSCATGIFPALMTQAYDLTVV